MAERESGVQTRGYVKNDPENPLIILATDLSTRNLGVNLGCDNNGYVPVESSS